MKGENDLAQVYAVDISEEYRHKIRCFMHFLCAGLVVPFLIIHAYEQHYLHVCLIFLFFIINCIDAVSYYNRARFVFSPYLSYAIYFIYMNYGLFSFGVFISYWSYPLLFVCHFSLPRKHAAFMTWFYIVTMSITSYYALGFDITLRFVITMILVNIAASVMILIQIEQQKNLINLALLDPLTGANNRRFMKESFESAAERVRRGYGQSSIVAVDLDHFKAINDNYGHDVGDRVLVELTELIKSRLRKIDMVYRAGGEEFLILLGDAEKHGAISFAEDLRQQVVDRIFHNDIKLTISAGVAEFDIKKDIDAWLKQADDFLYEAKERGRNCVMPMLA